jgi:predicted exporter
VTPLTANRIVLRCGLWTAAMLALLVLYVLRVAPDLRIETDLLALLPAAEQDSVAAAAQSRYADTLSRRLLFLVGALPRRSPAGCARRPASRK